MSTPFLGQIELFAFNFPPKGWAQCNGQFLPINQNQALFSLLGTMYGGNGQTTFALPDLRGRIPISMGDGFTEGQSTGSEFVTLNISQMAAHNHIMFADTTTPNANAATPGTAGSSVFGNSNGTQTPTGTFTVTIYNPGNPNNTLAPAVISNVGGNQPHENRMPFLCINFCIALQGIFPSQN